jgi:hypothetical protein
MTKTVARIGTVRLRTAREIFGMWFFGDVAYAILPIITIATINLATGASFDRFLLAPEWSFAAIVFFGLSIRYLLEIKARFEREQSYRLDTGTQFRVLLAIVSVLCLALVDMIDRIRPHVNEGFIESVQIMLFVGGLGALLSATVTKQSFMRARWAIPHNMTRLRFMLHLENSLNTAIDNCDYFSYAVGKGGDRDLISDNDFVSSESWEETNYSRVREKIARLKRSVDQMDRTFASFSENSRPITTQLIEMSK